MIDKIDIDALCARLQEMLDATTEFTVSDRATTTLRMSIAALRQQQAENEELRAQVARVDALASYVPDTIEDCQHLLDEIAKAARSK